MSKFEQENSNLFGNSSELKNGTESDYMEVNRRFDDKVLSKFSKSEPQDSFDEKITNNYKKAIEDESVRQYEKSNDALSKPGTFFRQFDSSKDLNEAANVRLVRRNSRDIDITMSMSKSSKAIDNLIGFKFSKYKAASKSNSNKKEPMDAMDWEKIKLNKETDNSHLSEFRKRVSSESLKIEPNNNDNSKSYERSPIIETREETKTTSKDFTKPSIGAIKEEIEPILIAFDADDPSTKLIEYCRKGEWASVDQLLREYNKENPLPNVRDIENDETLLMIACKDNRLVIIERLLELVNNVNDISQDGRNALHYAAKFSKEEVVKLLISKKADANVYGGNNKCLPLHLACSRNPAPPGIVTQLLKATKNARFQMDIDGAIPLMYAIEAGSLSTVKELLEHEGEAQANIKKKNSGDAAIHIACRKKDIDSLRMLCEVEGPINIQNASGQTALHICAEENDETILKYLYTNKANANIVDYMDRSALHMAADKGYTKIVEFLIDKFKCNVLTRDKDGNTLMHVTSISGHPDTTMSFLRRGVPLHMPNKAGSVCLHAAAQRGHVSVVRALLEKGANVNVRSKDLYTPLHIAVKYGNPGVVETLLGFGAEVNVKGGTSDETPLHIAATVKNGELCAEMLLKSGANVNDTMKKGETALHIAGRTGNLEMLKSLLLEKADPTLVSNEGNSSLHIGVRYCHYPIVLEIINFLNRTKTKMDSTLLVNLPNNEGETALHFAAEIVKKRIHSDFEDIDIMKLLLEYNGDMKFQTKYTEETPLHYCARAGNSDVLLEIVNFLESKIQSFVNKQTKNGWSPLLYASHNGHHEIVNILLKNNARVDIFDEHGMTALHLAAEKGHSVVAEVLLSHKAFVNAKSKAGLTPLHLAAQNNFKDLIEILINRHHATIDSITLNKKTPLHLAAQYGKRSVCETLLYNTSSPADANAADSKGQTPLHLASQNDHADVVRLFLRFKPELLIKANPDIDGMTCAHIAAANGSISVIKEFMRFNKSLVHGIKNKLTGSTSLHLAAEGGHYKVVKVLLNAGANPHEENNEGYTCLHIAAKYGHVQLLNCLKPKMSLKVISVKSGLTPLHVAAHFGQIDFVRDMLIDVPANIKSSQVKNDDHESEIILEPGLTPLHLAASSGHENLVRLLLNCSGVEVDSRTKFLGTIPLHYAAQNGHTNVTSLLLSKSAQQITKKDLKGRTALHFASSNGHLEMAALFIGQGAEINGKDDIGFTPLHFAAKSGFLDVCKLLVESGAKCEAETNAGKIPLIFAAHFNHTDVVSFLLRNNHSTEKLMEDHKFLYDLMICSKLNNLKSIEEFVLLSPAPAETAAKLSNEYRELSEKEKERSKDLLLVGDYCENMCTDLVALAVVERGADKLLCSIDDRGVQFLDLLIEMEQKEVISHPSVQQYLSDVWIGNLNWPIWKFLLLFLVLFSLPILWLLAMFPFGRNLFKSPVIKFILYLISHLYLTGLIMYVAILGDNPYVRTQSNQYSPLWFEWLLLICLSGQLVSELINPIDRYSLAILKYVIIFFSTAAVMTHLFGTAVTSKSAAEMIYIRNQLLAVSTFMCLVVTLDFLSIHHLFGPWTIIIRDLMGDLFRFLVILLIFLCGFACMLTVTCQPTSVPTAIDNIPSIWDMTFIFYFCLFGLVNPTDIPIVAPSTSYSNKLSQMVFGLGLLILIIVLINLLIAMMADTYDRIQEQCDTEWKFGRAKLIRNMKKTSPIPSPFILLSQLVLHVMIIYYKMRNLPMPKYSDENIADKDQILRRKSQIAPSIQGATELLKNGPENTAEVVQWPLIVKRYLAIRSSESDSVNHEEFPHFDQKLIALTSTASVIIFNKF